jgi:hypothetical protein
MPSGPIGPFAWELVAVVGAAAVVEGVLAAVLVAVPEAVLGAVALELLPHPVSSRPPSASTSPARR